MENLMSMFNPETMKNLMDNDEIKKMMNDPNMMNNIQNMMGNTDMFKGLNKQSGESCEDAKKEYDEKCTQDACGPEGDCCGGEINIDNLENIEIDASRLNVGDKVTTKDLKNETYNNRVGIIEDILPNGRFVIVFEDEKMVAIKEENLENVYENIENID